MIGKKRGEYWELNDEVEMRAGEGGAEGGQAADGGDEGVAGDG